MATLDDSGLGSALQQDGETPLTSKVLKRQLTSTGGRTPVGSAKKRKLSVRPDRSDWTAFALEISSDDFLMKEKIESESVEIEGSKWVLAVQRKRVNETVLMEVSLHCSVPSAAWYARCNIDLEIVTDENTHTKKFEDCTINCSSPSRGYSVDWRREFLMGGRVAAYLRVSRVCNKFVSFPDFTNPLETGHDELIVGDRVIYVDRNLLSLHSAFFARLFRGPAPFVLECKVEHLVATLRTVYPQKGVVDDSNACTIAGMAKHFQFWDTLERCEQHLLSSSSFSTLEKLEVALFCQMHTLLSTCSASLKSVDDVTALMEGERGEFAASERTKAYLFDVILGLKTTPKPVEVVIE